MEGNLAAICVYPICHGFCDSGGRVNTLIASHAEAGTVSVLLQVWH